MSATMARQGGQEQLEQSHMRLALNMAKIANQGFSCTVIEEKINFIKKPRAEVPEQKKRGVEFPGHNKVKAAIQRHPVMLRQNQSSGCPPCQNGTAKNPQTRWRRTATGAPPTTRRRVRTPELTPHPPGMPPAPPTITGNTARAEPSEIVNLPAGYTYSHTALPCTELFDDEVDTQHDTDFDPDMLTDEG